MDRFNSVAAFLVAWTGVVAWIGFMFWVGAWAFDQMLRFYRLHAHFCSYIWTREIDKAPRYRNYRREPSPQAAEVVEDEEVPREHQ